jgi:hypothetical protein
MQPLPVVCGSGWRLTSRTVSRTTRTRQQASTTRPPAPPIIMAKIQHAHGACDKSKRSATAAFLGDSGARLTRIPGCVRKVTSFLVLQGLGVSTIDKFCDLSTGGSFGICRQTAGVIHRPLCWCGARLAPSLPLSLTCVRERSADWRYVSSLAPRRRRPRAFKGTPPPGAPLWRLPPRDRARRVRTGGLSSPVIRAAFAALHPDRAGLLAKAALHSKGGREPGATRTCCARHTAARAPHLLRH